MKPFWRRPRSTQRIEPTLDGKPPAATKKVKLPELRASRYEDLTEAQLAALPKVVPERLRPDRPKRPGPAMRALGYVGVAAAVAAVLTVVAFQVTSGGKLEPPEPEKEEPILVTLLPPPEKPPEEKPIAEEGPKAGEGEKVIDDAPDERFEGCDEDAVANVSYQFGPPVTQTKPGEYELWLPFQTGEDTMQGAVPKPETIRPAEPLPPGMKVTHRLDGSSVTVVLTVDGGGWDDPIRMHLFPQGCHIPMGFSLYPPS